MLKYVGSFELLEKLGFKNDVAHTYYFLHKTNVKDNFYNPITIDIATRRIEYSSKEDLELIKSFVKNE